MTSQIPKSQKEFISLMEDIDSLLKEKNVPICNRPILAPLEISRKLKISFPLVPIQGSAIPGDYTGNSLSSHIQDWFEKRYGDRLSVQMGVGTGAIFIKSDPWKVIYPLIFGTVYFICDPNLAKYKNLPSFTANGPHTINIFNLILNFPQKLAESLARNEAQKIKQTFLAGLDALSYLDQIKKMPLAKEAKADFEAAVMHIFSEPPNFGLSKWASLQFSEKLLKAYLFAKNKKYPLNHKLAQLRELSIINGLFSFPENLVNNIQCPAGVRYGEVPVTLSESINAHYSSLGVCYFTAKAISSLK